MGKKGLSLLREQNYNKKVPVVSSHLKKVFLNEEENIVMIQFKDKSKYVYADVNSGERKRLISAASKGKQFWKEIRDIKPILESNYRKKVKVK